MNSVSDFVMRKYAVGALIAFVGLAAVVDGVSEGVWVMAAGAIVIILARAIQVKTRP